MNHAFDNVQDRPQKNSKKSPYPRCGSDVKAPKDTKQPDYTQLNGRGKASIDDYTLQRDCDKTN